MKKLFIIALACFAIGGTGSAQPYQYYFGTLHSHSSYSDGNQDAATSGVSTPAQSFEYAKGSYHFNFLGISEHNHSAAGMQRANYAKGIYQADTSTIPGEFIALYGMEYGVINNAGHLLIYGIDSLIGWESGNYDIYNAKLDYKGLFAKIAQHPHAFASLAHPHTGDYGSLLSSSFDSTAYAAIAGCAVRTGESFSKTTDYSDTIPAPTHMPYYEKLLAAGYHAGPAIDHDNHYTTFGRISQSRTVVLSQELSKDSILAAYRAMRFYASEDWNAKVVFDINGYPMGSSLQSGNPTLLHVAVADPDLTDSTKSILVHSGIAGSNIISTTFQPFPDYTDSFTLSIEPEPGKTTFYFMEITQKDGNKIYTAPIWVTAGDLTVPLYSVAVKGKQQGKCIQLDANIKAAPARRKFVWQKGYAGNDFTDISTTKDSLFANASLINTDIHPQSSWQYYRLKMTEPTGATLYSNVASVFYKDNSFQLLSLSPNPVKGTLYLNVQAAAITKAACLIYNSDGRLVKQTAVTIAEGNNKQPINMVGLPAGLYILTLQTPAGLLEGRFTKIN